MKIKMGTSGRLYLLLVGLLFFGLLIIARLFYWQVLSFESLLAAAEKQHYLLLKLPADRGQILASDGFPLVGSQEAFLLFASPKKLKETPETIAAKLSPIIATESARLETESMIKSRLSRQDLTWVPIAQKLDRDLKEAVDVLNIEGVGFESQEKRHYPEASVAAHLLGFVGSDANGQDKGYFGLEGYYDRLLKGQPGRVSQEADAFGRPILIGSFGQESSRDGRDLVLFLDRAIQFAVEENLKWGIQKFGAKAGSVVVMDPASGGILAMASFPSYDPFEYANFENNLYKNPVITDLFEPGSIIKPLVMAAALNEKAVTPSTRCSRCSGPREVSGETISTFDDQYHPEAKMVEILEHSDNVGMVFVAEELGKESLYDYLIAFGFGEKTGIDLEEEVTTEIRDVKNWRPIELATASFGQGIAVTRLQMIRAFAALANEGELVKPLVVEKIKSPDKEVVIKPKTIRRVVSSHTAKLVTEMLVSTVEKSPLHFPRDRIPLLKGFRIAAKSGTAQIPVAGKYDPEKTIASVIGFAPADKPRFVVLVSLIEPTARPWGSDTAGPIFFEIVKELLLYYGLQPG